MNDFAIVEFKGRQYQIEEGSEIVVDSLGEATKDVGIDKVLLLSQKGEVLIGNPFLEGIKITAQVLENFKGEKLRVAKFKAKSRYRRVQGFRAQLTKLKIKEIATLPKKTKILKAKVTKPKKKNTRSKGVKNVKD